MWKPIVGFEGLYEVSDDGRVRSLNRVVLDNVHGLYVHLQGKEMKLTPRRSPRDKESENQYLVVNLHKDGKSYVQNVHRLVAQVFIPNPDGLPTINHKDGVKYNNVVENLEWASFGDNNVHALTYGLRSPRGNAILQFNTDGTFIAEYKSMPDAQRKTGVSVGSISHCVNHRTDTAGGYVWKKKSECVTTIPQGSTSGIAPMEARRTQAG